MPTTDTSTLSIPQLRAAVAGDVIAPTDAGYDAARRVFVRGIDLRPAAIVRVADAADVAHVVRLARERGSELAVRGGGHSIPGYSGSDGGLVIDLTAMRALDIDVDDRSAWAQAGLTAGEFTTAVAAHGLATGFGDTASVGISGITLGGGIGYLTRARGLTIDNLLAAEVVTADGEILHADAEAHPDLFWALRGAGANVGVGTRLRYRLHELTAVTGGMLMLPATADTIAAVIAAAEQASDDVSVIVNIMIAPPDASIPAEHHGTPVMMVLLAHSGPADAGGRAVAPFRDVAAPLVADLATRPYPEMFRFTDNGDFHPTREVARSWFRDTFDRSVAAQILARLEAATAPMAVTQVRVLGGAIARVPVEATAYAHRDRRILIATGAVYEAAEDDEAHEAWVSETAAALREGAPGVYVNFLGDEGPARVREAYPGTTWERLTRIKAQYDPTNLFHRNQNIPPAGMTG